MRKKSRMGLLCLLAVFSIAVFNSRADFSGGSLSAQDDLHVRPDETVGGLLNDAGGEEAAAPAGGQAGLWRIVGVLVLGAGLGVFLLLSWQRRHPASAAATRARDSMEVIGRVALSPKHTACLLKVGSDRLVVVALCGETMRPLCTIDGEDEIRKIIGEVEEPAGETFSADDIEVVEDSAAEKSVSSRSFVSALRRSFSAAQTGVER